MLRIERMKKMWIQLSQITGKNIIFDIVWYPSVPKLCDCLGEFGTAVSYIKLEPRKNQDKLKIYLLSGNKTWCSKGREKVVHKEYERAFLDDYVWKIDGAYNYEIVSNEYSAIDKLQTIVVNYTSQRWLEVKMEN